MNEHKYWTIVDRPNIKTSEYLDEMRKLKGDNTVYSYYSNDELDKLCPAPKEVEYIKFRANIEPDTKHLNKSYNDFSKENKNWMTPRQGILLALSVYKITGEMLDVKGLTIFHALDYDGNAMRMCRRRDGRFYIDGYNSNYRHSDHGPREQFPLFPSLNHNPETIKIGEYTYNKDEVENALKDLKAI